YRTMDLEGAAKKEQITRALYLFCLIFQLPVEVYNPVRNRPFLLYLIIGLNLAIFIGVVGMNPESVSGFYLTFGAMPEKLLSMIGIFSLISYAFLHVSWFHVIFNMYFLWIFGDNVLDVFMDHGFGKGNVLFLVYYLVLSILAGLTHCLINIFGGNHLPLVGASGAVAGIIASYWLLFPKSQLYQTILFIPFKVPVWFYVALFLAGNVTMGLSSGTDCRISWEAHLGGFAAGYFLLQNFLPFKLEKMETSDN
ncbi:MAG: rhomboid family intramembrane serine protease, partial [Candidatus Wallbacteria bacterium]|nr:rhomboid family intramembrane serine protease [Candidatus Wallbacteria bacterium]